MLVKEVGMVRQRLPVRRKKTGKIKIVNCLIYKKKDLYDWLSHRKCIFPSRPWSLDLRTDFANCPPEAFSFSV